MSNKVKTRASSALRKQLLMYGNVKPATPKPSSVLSDLEKSALRALGNRVCSKTEAILSRRASFHVGTNNIIKYF